MKGKNLAGLDCFVWLGFFLLFPPTYKPHRNPNRGEFRPLTTALSVELLSGEGEARSCQAWVKRICSWLGRGEGWEEEKELQLTKTSEHLRRAGLHRSLPAAEATRSLI